MQLGFDNKKKVMWAAVFGIIAVLAFAYEVLPMFTGSTTEASSAPVTAPVTASRPQPRPAGKAAKKAKPENLDPTLRLDLLALSEKTLYEGNGRNIFVSHVEDIPQPIRSGATDTKRPPEDNKPHIYQPPGQPSAPPIPLKFYGFASSPGEPKRIFLKNGEDVFVAGEGDIVDRRYKVVRITNTTVEIQDLVSSGPSQTIPLTQG